MDRRLELETAITREDADLQKEKLGFIEKEKELQQMQHAYNEMLDSVRGRQNEKSLTTQRLQHLQERKGSLDSFLHKASAQLKGLDEGLAFTKRQIEDESGKIADLEEKLEAIKENVEDKRRLFDEKRSGIDSLRREYAAIQRFQYDAEKKVAVADTTIANIQRSLSQLSEEQSQRKEQIEQFEADRKDKSAFLNKQKGVLEDTIAAHEQTKLKILEVQTEIEGLRSKLADESRLHDAKTNEHDLLKSLVDKMEGYPESVKFLHNNPQWKKEAPLLSDVVYVKEEYRAAVENVLEPYLNYYVVKDLQEGLDAIHLLQNAGKGKAKFFMLDKLPEPTEVHHPQNTIPALQIVEVNEKYNRLMNYLLGNVFIAENEEALQDSNGAVILEKTGKFVKGKYSLTGGSVGLFEGKRIGRAKNLEKLATEIKNLQQSVSRLKEQLQAKHNEVLGYNEQLKENAIRQLQNEIGQLTNTVFSLQNKLESLNQQETSGTTKMQEFNRLVQENNDAIAGTRDELEKYNEQLEDLKDKLESTEKAYAMAEQDYNFANTAYNNANLDLTRQQSKVTSLKQELVFKTNQLTELNEQVSNSNSQLKSITGEIDDTASLLKELETVVVELMKNKEEEERKLNLFEQAYHNQRNELVEKENTLRQKQRNKEGIDTILTEIKDKLTDLRLQLAGMKERLHVEFRIDLDDILDEERTGDASIEELNEKSERMRKRLENIGEVNPTAIEAYTEMKKRYEFILEQKTDLVNAKDLSLIHI